VAQTSIDLREILALLREDPRGGHRRAPVAPGVIHPHPIPLLLKGRYDLAEKGGH